MGKKFNHTELSNNATGERKRKKQKEKEIIALSILEIMQHCSIYFLTSLYRKVI